MTEKALETKAVLALVLLPAGSAGWWLEGGAIAGGAGFAGILIAPNAKRLFAKVRSTASVTAEFERRSEPPARA